MNVDHRRPLVAFLAVVALAVLIVTLSPRPGSVRVLLGKAPSYVADISPDTLLGPALDAIPEVVPGLAPDRPTLAARSVRSDVPTRPRASTPSTPSASDASSATGGRTAVDAVTSVVSTVRAGRSPLTTTPIRSPRSTGAGRGGGTTGPGQSDQPGRGTATDPAPGGPDVAARPVTSRPLATVPSTGAAAAAAARGAAAGVVGLVGDVPTTLVPGSESADAGPRGIAHGWVGRLPHVTGAGLKALYGNHGHHGNHGDQVHQGRQEHQDRQDRGRAGAPGQTRSRTVGAHARAARPAAAPRHVALSPRPVTHRQVRPQAVRSRAEQVRAPRPHPRASSAQTDSRGPRGHRGSRGSSAATSHGRAPGAAHAPKRRGHADAPAAARPQDRGHQDRGHQDRGQQDRGHQDRGHQSHQSHQAGAPHDRGHGKH